MPATLLTRSIPEAAAVLRQGGTVAFPTETVYGLGASALDADAVAAVFRAKDRPPDNPLIVHVASADGVGRVARVTDLARRLLDAFAPGPISLVLPSRGGLPPAVTAGLDTVAVRVPGTATARALIEAAGVPLVAPSANRSGRPSPTTWHAVRDDLDGRIDAILQGEPPAVGIESTVVDVTGAVPVVLRPGAVTLEALRAVIPDTAVLGAMSSADPARSPGLRHRHYAPTARVRVLASLGHALPASDAAFLGLEAPPAGYGLVRTVGSVEDYARALFATFREVDAAGLRRLDALAVPEVGLGVGLMDRLRRAAEA